MIHFIKILKILLPKKLKYILHKIYFDFLMVVFEKIIISRKLFFYDLELPESKGIIDLKTRSLIRHKLYERFEIEAINKLNFWNNNFIDLGSSIGLCSYFVAKKMNSNFKHILVEPNKTLLEYSKLLLSVLENREAVFINLAIGYDSNRMLFDPGNTILSGKLVKYEPNSYLEIVKCTNLKSIIEENKIDSYNILIDIEGMSFLPIFQEEDVFKNCNKLIIEEAYSKKFNYEMIKNQLKKLGFKITYYENSWGSNIIGAEKLQ